MILWLPRSKFELHCQPLSRHAHPFWPIESSLFRIYSMFVEWQIIISIDVHECLSRIKAYQLNDMDYANVVYLYKHLFGTDHIVTYDNNDDIERKMHKTNRWIWILQSVTTAKKLRLSAMHDENWIQVLQQYATCLLQSFASKFRSKIFRISKCSGLNILFIIITSKHYRIKINYIMPHIRLFHSDCPILEFSNVRLVVYGSNHIHK